MTVLSLVPLAACVDDKTDAVRGSWIAKQASAETGRERQRVDAYNYWEIGDDTIRLTNFAYVSENGTETMRFDKSEDEAAYVWNDDKQIVIGRVAFDVEVGKKKLVLKSPSLEIEFERDGPGRTNTRR